MGDERKFLHDLSNPLATVFFILESTLDEIKSNQGDLTEVTPMLEKAYETLKKIKELMQERRQTLINRGE